MTVIKNSRQVTMSVNTLCNHNLSNTVTRYITDYLDYGEDQPIS